MDITVSPAAGPAVAAPPEARNEAERLMNVARDLEAAFLSEMLKHAGLGESREAFGGGIGEDQFASFLRDEQARAIAASGGIGLAESIFNSLVEKSDAQ